MEKRGGVVGTVDVSRKEKEISLQLHRVSLQRIIGNPQMRRNFLPEFNTCSVKEILPFRKMAWDPLSNTNITVKFLKHLKNCLHHLISVSALEDFFEF